MMNSLEVRAPFLDIDLVDFVRKIPATYKYRNGITKYILKKSLEKLLPKDILYRPKKGFGIPIGQWLKSNILDFSKNENQNGMNPEFIQRRIQEHKENKSDHRAFLWNLWVLQRSRQKSTF